MKWNMFTRWDAIQKMAENSEVVARDLGKYARREHRLNPIINDTKLTMTFDLTLPIIPQIEEAEREVLWRQRKLDIRRKRATPPISDEDFDLGLRTITMRSERKSFQEIGDAVWPRDQSQGGRKAKANRFYRLALRSVPRDRPRMPLAKITR